MEIIAIKFYSTLQTPAKLEPHPQMKYSDNL